MHPKVSLPFKIELEKMLQAKVIKPIEYLEWLSYMVPVNKPSSDIVTKILHMLKIFTPSNIAEGKHSFSIHLHCIILQSYKNHEQKRHNVHCINYH